MSGELNTLTKLEIQNKSFKILAYDLFRLNA